MLYLKYQINQHLEIIVAISFETFLFGHVKITLFLFVHKKEKRKKD